MKTKGQSRKMIGGANGSIWTKKRRLIRTTLRIKAQFLTERGKKKQAVGKEETETNRDSGTVSTFRLFFLPTSWASSRESMYLRRFWWKLIRP